MAVGCLYPSLCLCVGGVMAADCWVVMDAWEGMRSQMRRLGAGTET